MTVFEYLMVMVSVVLALALAQLLRGATEIVTNPNRYWIHSAWVAMIVILIIQFWWAYWDFNGVADWTLATFLYVLLAPILVFWPHICLYLRIDQETRIGRLISMQYGFGFSSRRL